MSISDIKHKGNKRVLIPSKEAAGNEKTNEKVQEKDILELPLQPEILHNPELPNPVTSRGVDPELYWMNKYGKEDNESVLKVDIRSLYRTEHISPKLLIDSLYKIKQEHPQTDLFDAFGNGLQMYEEDRIPGYYKHHENWSNRLIMGDSLLVMTSLLEREGLAGKVQTMYFDPPYGIKYNSNWQMKIGDNRVDPVKDEHLTGEPEVVKAYRDTWELGIHSYLSYLRDRLLVAKELLSESGSCFVQISEENIHLVRCLMDEIFGSENYISQISYRTRGMITSNFLHQLNDYILWYGKSIEKTKYHSLFTSKEITERTRYGWVELPDGDRRTLSIDEKRNPDKLPSGSRLFLPDKLSAMAYSDSTFFEFTFQGKKYSPVKGRSWQTSKAGMENLNKLGRLMSPANTLCYIRYFDDYSMSELSNIWSDVQGELSKEFVVQTSTKVIQRCLLMTTDPGDLVIDPTCGSGTSAFVAEQWGRRWITIDTSRIALNIAKTRIMTAMFPYYKLHDDIGEDVRQGFLYKKVPHITLKSLANDEQAEEETLFDQPLVDNKKFRVAGPFTVETLQSLDVINPDDLLLRCDGDDTFEQRIYEHLQTAGIKNGIKNEQAKFIRIDQLPGPWIHAEGYYATTGGERKAYIHIGPKFGTVSKQAVNEAVKDCRAKGDADWLVVLGFSFDSDIENKDYQISNLGNFVMTKVRMHDDLLQDGLLKRDPKAASFVTIGEPDIEIIKNKGSVQVEIKGMDIYDPIDDEVKPRDVHDIAYWMVDDDYNGSDFFVKQVFFCGGDKDEFTKWKKNLDKMSEQKTRDKVNQTLKIEIDEDAFERLYGNISHPIPIESGKPKKIAVRVISQFGEECTKIISI